MLGIVKNFELEGFFVIVLSSCAELEFLPVGDYSSVCMVI